MSPLRAKTNIDFIGIGAQKAGTTWLYSRLKELPEFSLPPVKELHYFDRSHEYPSLNFLDETYLKDRLRKAKRIYQSIKPIFNTLIHRNIKNFKWLLNWYFSDYNDEWYLSLFDSLHGIKGEISPSYSILNENDIKKMHTLVPKTKLIFLMRNPIDRAWSHYRFNTKYSPKFNFETVTNDHIINFINSESQELRSNYIRTLDNYSKNFPEEQIIIAFYDAITDNPLLLLSEIVEFIGGDITSIPKYCRINVVNNPSRQTVMPNFVKDYLKEKYHSLMEKLAERYGGYCAKWYNETFSDNAINYKSEKMILQPTFKTQNSL